MDAALLNQYWQWVQVLLDHPNDQLIFLSPDVPIERAILLRACRRLARELSLPEEGSDELFLRNLQTAITTTIQRNAPVNVGTLEDLVKEWEVAKSLAGKSKESDKRFQQALRRIDQAHVSNEIATVTGGLAKNLFATVENGESAIRESVISIGQIDQILPAELSEKEREEARNLILSQVSDRVARYFAGQKEVDDSARGIFNRLHIELKVILQEYNGGKVPLSLDDPKVLAQLQEGVKKHYQELLASFTAKRNIGRIYAAQAGSNRVDQVASLYVGKASELGYFGKEMLAFIKTATVRETTGAKRTEELTRAQQLALTLQTELAKEIKGNPSFGYQAAGIAAFMRTKLLDLQIEPSRAYQFSESFSRAHATTIARLSRLYHLQRLPYARLSVTKEADDSLSLLAVNSIDGSSFPFGLLSLPYRPNLLNVVRTPVAAFAVGSALTISYQGSAELREHLLLSLLGLSDLETLQKQYPQTYKEVRIFIEQHRTLTGFLQNYWRLTNLPQILNGPLSPKTTTFTALTQELAIESEKTLSEEGVKEKISHENARRHGAELSSRVSEPTKERKKRSFADRPFNHLSLRLTRWLRPRIFNVHVVSEGNSLRMESVLRSRIKGSFRNTYSSLVKRPISWGRVRFQRLVFRGTTFRIRNTGGFTRILQQGLSSFSRGFRGFSGSAFNSLVRGGGNFLNSITNGLGILRNGIFLGGRAAVLVLFNPVIGTILIIGVLALFVIVLTGAGFPEGGSISIGGGGNIAQCRFYRGGDRVQGIRIGNPQMASLISTIANTVGVPPAIVAGIMQVETASALASTDPSYVANDYDAHSSGVAYGVMQFTPGTFTGTFNNNRQEMSILFGKTNVSTNIVPQGSMEAQNILRIYSIRDSIIASAFLVKNLKQSINGSGPWDRDTISRIASRYYSDGTCTKYPSCVDGPYDYGEDLWRSYSNCTSPTGLAASCPVQGPYTITNGTRDNPIPGRGGHCDPNYARLYPFWCPRNSPGVANAIDVAARDERTLAQIALPTIEGKPVRWNYERGNYTDINVRDIGFGHDFTTVVDGHAYFLHLFHLDQNLSLIVGQGYNSGEPAANMYNMGGPHVHFTISRDRVEMQPHIPPPGGMGMCSNP